MEILVADNNKNVTKIIKMALEEEGYSVATANSIDETLKITSEKKFDILIIDTKFEREKDGYELAKKIRKNNKDSKIVMLINALEKPEREMSEEIGIYSFLTKPVDSRKLFQIISEIESEIKPQKTKKEFERKDIEEEEIVIQESISESEYEEEKEKIKKKAKDKREVSEEEKKEEFEKNFDLSEEGAEEEKKDISFRWMEQKTLSVADELSALLGVVKEIFGEIKNIKDEAEKYVKEIQVSSTEFRKKIEEIPPIEKIISKITSDVSFQIKTKIEYEINEMAKNKFRDIEEKIKGVLEKLVAETIESIYESKKSEIINNLEKMLYEKIDNEIEKKSNQIKDEILSDVKNLIKLVGQQEETETKKTLSFTNEFAEDIAEKFEEEESIREESQSYAEVLTPQTQEDFLIIDEIETEGVLEEKEEKSQKEIDFISLDEI